jgi:hypothetical protein
VSKWFRLDVGIQPGDLFYNPIVSDFGVLPLPIFAGLTMFSM